MITVRGVRLSVRDGDLVGENVRDPTAGDGLAVVAQAEERGGGRDPRW